VTALPARPFLRARVRGFTLIEILVALLILGIMSALGYETYRAARISAERSEESLKRSREIEFGIRMMVMDFVQMVPRPVRDPLGDSRLPALRGYSGNGTSAGVGNSALGGGGALGSDFQQQFNSQHFNSDPAFQSSLGGTSGKTTVPLAELTRAGWSNTAGQQRSTLQRVSYSLVDDVVKRSYTTSLDTVLATQPQIQDLLSGVKTVQLRYLDGNQTWQTQWPPPTLPLNEGLWVRPVAVEITVEFKDWGRVQRVIEVAG
jgi:general secretion pathway protein J